MPDSTRRTFLRQSAAVAAASAALTASGEAAPVEPARSSAMRLCRYQFDGKVRLGFYADTTVIDVHLAAAAFGVAVPDSIDPLDFLPPAGKGAEAAAKILERYAKTPQTAVPAYVKQVDAVKLLVPLAKCNKAILLAGNYASHIREGGGLASERADTFPYYFWKPPTTTLTNPGDPIKIPKVSPNHVDWELELGVVIGATAFNVSEADALKYVAGYTVCNDVSDRKFTINPNRKPRERDKFHDWLHGKWHDTFLPAGPCIATLPDPQKLKMTLKVNGQVMQDSDTGQMIFPCAALVSVLSTFMTLEPGDIIVTGTPAGVGAGRKPQVFLKAGDTVDAWIENIGLLRNPVVNG